jgi:hypothetical protein
VDTSRVDPAIEGTYQAIEGTNLAIGVVSKQVIN